MSDVNAASEYDDDDDDVTRSLPPTRPEVEHTTSLPQISAERLTSLTVITH